MPLIHTHLITNTVAMWKVLHAIGQTKLHFQLHNLSRKVSMYGQIHCHPTFSLVGFVKYVYA